eukprot:872760-Prymnesium_polylepis.1
MDVRPLHPTSHRPARARSRPVSLILVFLGAIFLMRGEPPLTAIPCPVHRQISRLLLLPVRRSRRRRQRKRHTSNKRAARKSDPNARRDG